MMYSKNSVPVRQVPQPLHIMWSVYFDDSGRLTVMEFRSSLSERSASISLMIGERYG